MDNLLISEEDKHLLLEYSCYFDKSNGYWKTRKNGKRDYLHRIIMKAKNDEIIDHINQIKTDNRRLNLRVVTKKLNNYNRIVKNKNGRGIYFDKSGERYRACISHENKTLKLGSFKTINDAKEAYNIKALEIYGKNAFQHILN